MTTQVFKAIQLNGKTIYSHKDKIVRTSKRDYKYALLFLAKECMGATRDAEDWRVIGLGLRRTTGAGNRSHHSNNKSNP